MKEQTMKTLWILLITLLCGMPANAVVITCVSEGSGVVRIDYNASDETVLPIAFALDVTVDGGAIIKNVYDYKVGDSNAASPGYGIFPASMKIDENGEIFDWGSPVDNNGIGTSAVTLGMASRYSDVTNAPKVSGTLCRILVDTRSAPTVNVNAAANITGGGVVLQNATAAKFSAVGCTLGGSSPPPAAPSAPGTITYPASSSTGQYAINWSSSSGAASYQLERSNDAGSTWSQIYSDGNLTCSENAANGNYRYRVKATNAAGSSGWTTGTADCVVSITTPSPAIPLAPATITYPASSSTGQYTISWASSSGATSPREIRKISGTLVLEIPPGNFSGYRLERSRNGDDWTRIYSGANNTYSERVSSGSYRYRVRAINDAGTSDWRTGTTACVVSIISSGLQTPSSISYPERSSTGHYTISWPASSGATLPREIRKISGPVKSEDFRDFSPRNLKEISEGTLVLEIPPGNFSGYQLQRSNGRTWTQIYSGDKRAYSESVGNGSYRYRVRATSTAGTSSWRTGTSTCRVSIENSRDDDHEDDD